VLALIGRCGGWTPQFFCRLVAKDAKPKRQLVAGVGAPQRSAFASDYRPSWNDGHHHGEPETPVGPFGEGHVRYHESVREASESPARTFSP
jgi:hypothetical protein